MNHAILEEILDCPDLPSLPAVAAEVLELTGNPDVRINDLAEVIQRDQALSAKILRTVNSSFYGLRERCSSIQKALVPLGLGPVKSLVLGFSLVNAIDGEPKDFDFISYWRRSIYTAVGSRCVAEHACPDIAEEAFLGGLLQDIGIVASMRALGDRYHRVLAMAGDEHSLLVRYELEQLDIQHPDIGAMLAETWKLPKELSTPIKYHERPTACPQEFVNISHCVGMGNIIHDLLTADDPTPRLRDAYIRGKQWFRLLTDDVNEILDRAATASGELSGLFQLDTGHSVEASEVLSRANKQLLDMVRQEPRETYAASKLDQLLKGGGDADPLTGAIGQPGFDRAVRAAFDPAARGESSLAVVQIELGDLIASMPTADAFARDEVVIGVVVQLNKHFESHGGVVCRTGETAFAVVLPGVTRRTAVRIAEAFRQDLPMSVPAMCGQAGNIAPPPRVAIGVAAIEPECLSAFKLPEHLITAASRAVDAARNAGGDVVRAFVPRAA